MVGLLFIGPSTFAGAIFAAAIGVSIGRHIKLLATSLANHCHWLPFQSRRYFSAVLRGMAINAQGNEIVRGIIRLGTRAGAVFMVNVQILCCSALGAFISVSFKYFFAITVKSFIVPAFISSFAKSFRVGKPPLFSLFPIFFRVFPISFLSLFTYMLNILCPPFVVACPYCVFTLYIICMTAAFRTAILLVILPNRRKRFSANKALLLCFWIFP